MDSLDIRRGEQVALVGDNASGKSRLASVFAGRNAAKYITQQSKPNSCYISEFKKRI